MSSRSRWHSLGPPRKPSIRPILETLELRVVLSQSAIRLPIVLHGWNSSGANSSGESLPQIISSGPVGYTPDQLIAAYGLGNITFGSIKGDGAGQTIAIVNAYDDPAFVDSTINGQPNPAFSSSDLAVFDSTIGIPDPPSFTKYNQEGQLSPMPATDPAGAGNLNGTWEMEESLDVEWAHAIAPGASIDLVEANDDVNNNNLFDAVATAATLPGVSVVSMSWGLTEYNGEQSVDSTFTTPTGHQGVTFVAASGDQGSPGYYPAYSPNVVAVGGTTLNLNENNTIQSELAWSGSGGGISAYETEPAYQEQVQNTGKRTIPDVAWDADPNTGVAVYDSYDAVGNPGAWLSIGGTSLASPSWAALFAIADQGRALAGASTLDGPTQTLPALYYAPSADFNDITQGSNGGFDAGPGYDEVTGLGSPRANLLIPDLVSYGAATQMVVTAQPPANVIVGQPFGVAVSAENVQGDVDPGFSGTVSIALENNPTGATLGGTLSVTAVNGVAVFDDLTLNTLGSGYSFIVTSSKFGTLTTDSFNVIANPTPGSGTFYPVPTDASLRSAFAEAMSNDDASNTIVLATATYILDDKTAGQIVIQDTSSLPAKTLTIVGQGEASSIIEPGNSSWTDRIFEVLGTSAANVTVIFQDLAIEGGYATGGGTLGGTDALGGGILIDGGTVRMTRVAVSNNVAQGIRGNNGKAGAKGQAGGNGDDGDNARGGGIYLTAGTLTLDDDLISNNSARGGIGGTGGAGGNQFATAKTAASRTGAAGGAGGNGGSGAGGGVYVAGGSLRATGDTFATNRALGGDGGLGGMGGDGILGKPGGDGGDGGPAGPGYGGAFYLAQGSLTIDLGTLSANSAVGGAGGQGGTGGAGSSLEVSNSTGITLSSGSIFGGSSGALSKAVRGGDGGKGGTGGAGAPGEGGGVYVGGGSLTLFAVTLGKDQAIGGQGGQGGQGGTGGMGSLGGIFGTGTGTGAIVLGGSGGSGGGGNSGYGGGLYLAGGTVTLDAVTLSADLAKGGDGGSGGVGGAGGLAGGLSFSGGSGSNPSPSIAFGGDHGGIPQLSFPSSKTGTGGGGLPSGGPGGDGGDGGDGKGGALYVSGGSLTLYNGTVADNSVEGGTGGTGGKGGKGGSLGLGNGPSGQDGNPGDSYGGGLYVDGGTVDLYNSSVALNTQTGTGSGGGGVQVNGTVTVVSTLFAGNGAVDYSGNINATDSLFQTTPVDGTVTGSQNLIGKGPLLATAGLASNGGPTQTIALQAGSPAIGAGANPEGLLTDQRGYAPRAGAGGTDIGAYQHNATADTTPPTATPTAPAVTGSNASSLDPYTFTVTYADNTAVAAASVVGVVVDVGPPGGGAPIVATVNSTQAVGPTDPMGNAQSIIVTYEITPPGGSWTVTDNGTYTLSLAGPPPTDLSGNALATEALGTFVVNINPTPNNPASAMLLGVDTLTHGNWIKTFGSQGDNAIGNTTSYPSYATVTPAGQSNLTWSRNTTNVDALQNAGGTGRTAAAWVSTSSFTVDVDLTDGQAHDITLYALDWNNQGRSEQIQILNASTGAVLSTETLSSFGGGVYLDYMMTGNVEIEVTRLAGASAVLSGLFFDPPTNPATTTTVSVAGSNATTRGNWIGTFGAQGYDVIGKVASYPSSVIVTPLGQSTTTWARNTTNVGALQNANGTGRAAAAWVSASSFTVDINFTDGQAHKITAYALDWNNQGRSEQIQVINPVTGAVLDTQTISSFSGGVYLEWTVSGHVVIRVTRLAGPNAVLSGLFFDPPGPSSSAPPTLPSQLFVTTQPPTVVFAGTAFGLTVSAVNSSGQLDTSYNGTVTASIGSNPTGGSLLGTLTAQFSNGVAVFSDLILSQAGNGYTIELTLDGVPPLTSASIDVKTLGAKGSTATATAAVAPPSGASALATGTRNGGSSGTISIATTGMEAVSTTNNADATIAMKSQSRKDHKPRRDDDKVLTRMSLRPTQLLDHNKSRPTIAEPQPDIRNHPLLRRNLART